MNPIEVLPPAAPIGRGLWVQQWQQLNIQICRMERAAAFGHYAVVRFLLASLEDESDYEEAVRELRDRLQPDQFAAIWRRRNV
jgi:hypothetical protein